MKFNQFDNTNDYAREAAQAIEQFILEKLEEKKIVRVALSGGQSPVPVYRELAKSTAIKWGRVAFFLVDERYVPLNSKDSNYGMIKKNLTDYLNGLRKFYHYNTRDPISKLVHQYQELLKTLDEPLFDLVVLGLGADGHTASLFPGAEALEEKRELVLHTQQLEGGVQDRLTLTFPAVLSSSKIVFLIQGAEKKRVVERWLSGEVSTDELPATEILGHEDVEVYYNES